MKIHKNLRFCKDICKGTKYHQSCEMRFYQFDLGFFIFIFEPIFSNFLFLKSPRQKTRTFDADVENEKKTPFNNKKDFCFLFVINFMWINK